jgi:glycosyltransferase involved in cell wall biosynthesis
MAGLAMVHYSVLIPQRDAADALRPLLVQLSQVLDGLLLPFEIICIDDASAQPAAGKLEDLVAEYPQVRILRFDEPRGAGAALTAGLAASGGDLVIALGAGMGAAVRHIPQLIARLSQHDLVIARRERTLLEEVRQGAARLPRLITRQAQLQPCEELFWAARRQAVCGLTLAQGAFRILARIVARRGFRVCDLVLADGLPPRGTSYRPSVVDRLAGLWLDRSFEPHLASERPRGAGGAVPAASWVRKAGGLRTLQPPVSTSPQKHADDAGRSA